MGSVAALASLMAIGTPVLLGRGLGLLSFDRRFWWLGVTIAAYMLGRFLMLGTHQFKKPQDAQHAFFLQFQLAGLGAAIVIGFVVGMLVLWKLGADWRTPLPRFSSALSLIIGLTLIWLVIDLQSRPDRIRHQRDVQYSQWLGALKTSDLEVIRQMTVRGEGKWQYLKELGSDPLGYAVFKNNLQLFRQLIAIQPRQKELIRKIALATIQTQNLTFLEAALVHFNEEQAFGIQALCQAARHGNRLAVCKLLDERVHPDGSFERRPLVEAISQGHREIAEMLLQNGASINALARKSKVQPESALQAAVQHVPDWVPWLLERGADPNACQAGSCSPLMRAARARDTSVMSLLIEVGASVRYVDDQGDTALHLAAYGQKPGIEAMNLLIAKGADPNQANHRGFVPARRL